MSVISEPFSPVARAHGEVSPAGFKCSRIPSRIVLSPTAHKARLSRLAVSPTARTSASPHPDASRSPLTAPQMQGGFPPALAGVFLQDHHVPEVVGVLNHVIQSQSSPYRFGTFRCVSASEVPPRVRELVSHTDNLTLVLERFCHTRFEIDVVSKLKDSKKCFYSRQVLLRVPGEEGEAEQGNGQEGDGALGGDVDMEGAVLGGCAVSLGVICVDLAAMRPEVRRDIESERVPFGRILENHGVKREVKVDQLWKVNADRDSHLWTLFHNRHFSSHTNGTDLHTYGRTVEMTCDGKPAVLVLEVLNLPPLQAVALARGIRLDEPANEQPDGGKTRFGMAAEAGERDREREEGGR